VGDYDEDPISQCPRMLESPPTKCSMDRRRDWRPMEDAAAVSGRIGPEPSAGLL